MINKNMSSLLLHIRVEITLRLFVTFAIASSRSVLRRSVLRISWQICRKMVSHLANRDGMTHAPSAFTQSSIANWFHSRPSNGLPPLSRFFPPICLKMNGIPRSAGCIW